MKRFLTALIIASFAAFAGASFANAADWETYELIDRLLTLPGPGAPEVLDDTVIFTAPSSQRRVGISFAYENFSKIYWFQRLMVSQDPLDAPIPPGKKVPDPYKDSGILFYVHQLPKDKDLGELEYRLVINGLWTTDPANVQTRRDAASGLALSVLPLPPKQPLPDLLKNPGGLSFNFKGPPGETVTVAGSFNGWDPFMYELQEYPAGTYTLNLPLPPGKYQYIFFHRGERYLDPYNSNRVWSRDGVAASEIVIP